MKRNITDIKMMEKIDRPREKLKDKGVDSLSDIELIEIIVGSGNSHRKLHEIANDILKLYLQPDIVVDRQQLCQISGIGSSRAALFMAAMEFSKRQHTPSTRTIRTPEDVLPLLNHYRTKKQEYFVCISLNGAYEVIKTEVVSIGLLNRTLVHPREVFAEPIARRAAAVIVAHNHPSGNVQPSIEDKQITERLRKAGDLLGIAMLDHIIIAKNAHYSFLNSNASEEMN